MSGRPRGSYEEGRAEEGPGRLAGSQQVNVLQMSTEGMGSPGMATGAGKAGGAELVPVL